MREAFGADVTSRSGYRAALTEASILLNTALTAYTLQHALGDRAADAPQASYGVYVISTRRIWAPRAGSDDCDGLARPPADAAGFAHLAAAVIRSSRLRELLGEAEAGAATSAAPRAADPQSGDRR